MWGIVFWFLAIVCVLAFTALICMYYDSNRDLTADDEFRLTEDDFKAVVEFNEEMKKGSNS